MDKYFMPIYTTIVGIVIGALSAWIKNLVKSKKNSKEMENKVVDSLVDGMAILLRKQIKEYYEFYEYKDSILMEDWEEIESTHQVYKQLHGNHSGDKMYEELKSKHLQGGVKNG